MMDLTPEIKQHIDGMKYEALLRLWRFNSAGDTWFQGETGKYWGERMAVLKARDPDAAVSASKLM